MHFLWWIAVVVAAGWATGQILSDSEYGALREIALGIGGALLGGFLMRALGYASQGGLFYTIAVAIGGAVIIVGVGRFFRVAWTWVRA